MRRGSKKSRAVCLKKQIGKSTLRGQNEGIPGGGAYPFPGDLRAKFAWKEANRLSRGELIDNTAVTCSSLDRRPAALPLSSSAAPLSPSLSLLRYPPCASPRPLQLWRNSLYLFRSARDTTQSLDPAILDLPSEFRDSTYRICVTPSIVWAFCKYAEYQASSQIKNKDPSLTSKSQRVSRKFCHHPYNKWEKKW